MLDPIAEPMANLLAFFYSIWPSYAGSIILLTTAVMLVLTPLTYTGTKSMIKMQRLQPELKRIQKEYKEDRQQLNEEMMKFYKENQVNPLGGCLPLLLQMPVFIVLFQVLRGLTRKGADGTFDPKYVSHDTALYRALDDADEMISFGFDLAISASEALSQSFVTALPYLSMIAIVLVTGIIQQRQIAGRNPGAQSNPQQQMIMRIMPVFIAFISFTLQGALVIYFVVSNLFRVGQQWFITRSLYRDDEGAIDTSARELTVDDGEGPVGKPSGLFGSIRDMFDDAKGQATGAVEDSGSKGKTAPKGRATPARDDPPPSGRSKPKGANKRTTAPKPESGGIAQPRPRKRKKR
jgi:YidC/Oxa1 family membrane protein insertase